MFRPDTIPVSPGKHPRHPALAKEPPMTRTGKAELTDQFELFLPYIADMPLRDQREMMERPFFSLAKSKRVKPIVLALQPGISS